MVLLMGFSKDMVEWIKSKLYADTSKKPARYVGAPSSPSDRKNLYKQGTIAEAVQLVWQEVNVRRPYRILVLYVPCRNDQALMTSLGVVCFLTQLTPYVDKATSFDGSMSWRHDKATALKAVHRALDNAWRKTNSLKAEITDKRISALGLPARNFYFPDRDSTIHSAYREIAQGTIAVDSLRSALRPTRFNRTKLPNKAFKGQQHTDTFFQDCRGRVFPPDPYHGQRRIHSDEAVGEELPLAVQQIYRFGVTVRDGNLHYDVQYEMPRQLNREPMHCAVDGEVRITGTHANVGVNDFVWVPGGKKVTEV